MKALKVLDAAKLVGLAYGGPAALPGVAVNLSWKSAQAYLLADDTLVIPGTNEPADWAAFNLQLWHALGKQAGWPARIDGQIATEKWLYGFADHAATVRHRMGARRPAFIIGHSLGAASAQILAVHYRVPTVAFCGPAVHIGQPQLLGEGWCLNLHHSADPVPHLWGQGSGIRHLGSRYRLGAGTAPGNHHSIAAFTPTLAAAIAAGGAPEVWPPPG